MNLSTTSITMSIATFRAQTLDSLVGAGNTTDANASAFGDIFSQLVGQAGGTSCCGAAGKAATIAAASSVGRNTSLRDPEAAYSMMTEINRREVTYKAQYSELDAIENTLPKLSAAANLLDKISADDGAAAVKTQVQAFAQQYNEWIKRYAPDVEKGGVLAGTQAAEISLYELEQSVKNIFVGAKDGFRGLEDMGIAIDPKTRQMTIDNAKLETALSGNAKGVVDALHDFAGNFAKSADLLASKGNFVQNRMNNLDRAIHYIGDHVAAWRQEFGTGDAPQPTGQIATALAAYKQAHTA